MSITKRTYLTALKVLLPLVTLALFAAPAIIYAATYYTDKGIISSETLNINTSVNFLGGDLGANRINLRNIGGGDDSDPYSIRKTRDAANANHLDIQLNDDSTEELRIYGNSCSGYGCGDTSGNLYHRFRADGWTWHAGGLQAGAYVPQYGNWADYGTGDGGAAIYNDNRDYKALMIVGNSAAGGARQVKMWDGLTVYGDVSAGNITASGNITLGNGYTFSSAGRMHISGGEILYLLNASGVVVSQAWGGNGNLTVEGNIYLGNLDSVRWGGWSVYEMSSGMTIPYGLAFMYGSGKMIIGTDGSLIVGSTTKWEDYKYSFHGPIQANSMWIHGHTKIYQGNLTVQYGSAYKDGGGSWAATSDARTKKDVTPFTSGLSVIDRLQPVNFTYNGLAGTPEGLKAVGFIAQDVVDIAPWMLATRRDKLRETDAAAVEIYNLDPSSLPFVNLNAIKELNAKVSDLEAKNAELENRLKAIEELLRTR